jgi:hypothetical protein
MDIMIEMPEHPCIDPGSNPKVSSILRKAIPILDLRRLIVVCPTVTRNYYSNPETRALIQAYPYL